MSKTLSTANDALDKLASSRQQAALSAILLRMTYNNNLWSTGALYNQLSTFWTTFAQPAAGSTAYFKGYAANNTTGNIYTDGLNFVSTLAQNTSIIASTALQGGENLWRYTRFMLAA